MIPTCAALQGRLIRAWRITHRIAYPIWVVLLAARVAIVIAALCLLVFDWAITPAHAQGRDIRQERQQSLDQLLSGATKEDVAFYRTSCAAGRRPASIGRARAVGAKALPDAVELCMTVLTRMGRDGDLHALRNADGGVTPALALDAGFVAGYGKGGSGDALPTADALRATAQMCLAQTTTDKALCYSVGYSYGVRAASGEMLHAR